MDFPAGLYIETHLSKKPSITENSIRAFVSAIRGWYARGRSMALQISAIAEHKNAVAPTEFTLS